MPDRRGTLCTMVVLIIGMLLCVGLAVAVVALVAIPARREGRDLLTPQGEELVSLVKDSAGATLDRTGGAIVTAKDKVADAVTTTAVPASADERGGRHRAG
jgi:hypothetical protein